MSRPSHRLTEEVTIESGFFNWNWVLLLRILLCASSLFYALSLVALLAGRSIRSLSRPPVFERFLGLALVCHSAFTVGRAFLVGRVPFFGGTELISWFALCCGLLCLFGSRRFGSRFVIAFGVTCAFVITMTLAVSYRTKTIPGVFALRDVLAWWYGFATPLAYAAGLLAFAAQLRGVLASSPGTRSRPVDVFLVSEEAMNSLALSLVRFCYPLLLSGVLTFAMSSLDAVGRAWFWQRSIAAQLFVLVAYSVYMHLCTSTPLRKGRIVVAQFAAFAGLLVSVLSFELPQGLLRGLGLNFFL